MKKDLQLWKLYSVVTTLAVGVLAVSAFTVERPKTRFGTIDVERINVVEPDGTLRMVISDQARFPGAIIKGKEYAHPRHAAGMIFYNDEATENGGLIFGGKKNKDGTVSSYGHLSFDRYEQDQSFTLDAAQQGKKKTTSLAFIDRPDWPLTDLLNLPRSRWKEFLASHPEAATRMLLERASDGSVFLALKDRQGHNRIVIKVRADGSPIMQFLNASGKVMSQYPAPQRH